MSANLNIKALMKSHICRSGFDEAHHAQKQWQRGVYEGPHQGGGCPRSGKIRTQQVEPF